MLVSQRRVRESRQRAFLQALPTPESCVMTPIGIVRSPYTLRYDCPRQPTAVPGLGAAQPEPAAATIQLYEGMGLEASVRDLANFDYVWLMYLFHANESWKPLVALPPDPEAPDNDGGNDGGLDARALRRPRRRVGVLSSRAPHRPNPLGLSALRLVRAEGLELHVHGIDCLDRTPVLDIKPYIPLARMVKVAVLAGAYRATTGSLDCVRRLEAALLTRKDRPDASDQRTKRRLFSHTPPKSPLSLRLTMQVRRRLSARQGELAGRGGANVAACTSS